MIKRDLYIKLWNELISEKPMIFLSGPRQVGKTTLAKEISAGFVNKMYFNWDIIENKKLLFQNPSFFTSLNRTDDSKPLIVFDEIHKYKKWKNYLKSVYDQYADEYKFLVSGSGRLDVYQKGSDSLAGRYFQFHLFPLTIAELNTGKRTVEQFIKNPVKNFDLNNTGQNRENWERLFNIGGFPEPFVKGTKRFLMKWSTNYLNQLIREDIKSISDIRNIDNIQVLYSLLPGKVGAPLSTNNLVSDIQASFASIKEWLNLFEKFYLIFRVSPYTKKISRAILKEKKVYLYNYTEISDTGCRFENMAALELLRAVYSWNEHGYGRFNLNYVRNKDKEEVDFLITENNRPLLLVEVKLNESEPSRSLRYFQRILNIPAVQLVNAENIYKYHKNENNEILVVTANRWFSSLP